MSNTTDHLPRMYIVFRGDLPEMTRAKGEVQAAHAAASLIYQYAIAARKYDLLRVYFFDGKSDAELGSVAQVKVIMEVPNLDALQHMEERARKRGVETIMIKDAAHTVFSEPTITCLGIGPCSKTDGNAITRGAKMRT